MRWVFIPRNAHRWYFAVAAVVLSQGDGGTFVVVGDDDIDSIRQDSTPVGVRKVELRSPLEFAVSIAPAVQTFTPLLQTDKRWALARLGEGGETIGRSGCLVTSLAMMLQDIYHSMIWPDVLADVLAIVRDAFSGDYLDWFYVAGQLSLLSDPIRKNGAFSPGYVQSLIEQGYKIIVANPKISHFGYLLGVVGSRYKVADPMVGVTEWRGIGGIRAARVGTAPSFDGPYALYVEAVDGTEKN